MKFTSPRMKTHWHYCLKKTKLSRFIWFSLHCTDCRSQFISWFDTSAAKCSFHEICLQKHVLQLLHTLVRKVLNVLPLAILSSFKLAPKFLHRCQWICDSVIAGCEIVLYDVWCDKLMTLVWRHLQVIMSKEIATVTAKPSESQAWKHSCTKMWRDEYRLPDRHSMRIIPVIWQKFWDFQQNKQKKCRNFWLPIKSPFLSLTVSLWSVWKSSLKPLKKCI